MMNYGTSPEFQVTDYLFKFEINFHPLKADSDYASISFKNQRGIILTKSVGIT